MNEENRKQNEAVSPGNQSRAAHSSIKSPDEDNRASMAQGIINDLGNQRADIDIILQTVQEMGKQINQITQALNQLARGVTPQTPEQGKVNMETISLIGDLFEKGAAAYKSFKGEPSTAPALINQDFINKRMVESFMDDLDTGTSITNFIKDSLKKKVTKEVINKSLSDMGKPDTHAP